MTQAFVFLWENSLLSCLLILQYGIWIAWNKCHWLGQMNIMTMTNLLLLPDQELVSFRNKSCWQGQGRELLAKNLHRKWNNWECSLAGKRKLLLSLVHRPKAPGVRLGFLKWWQWEQKFCWDLSFQVAGDASVKKKRPSQSQGVLQWKSGSFKGFLTQFPLAWSNPAQ